MSRGNRHYAWNILAACCMIQGGIVGMVQNSCGIFYQPVCKELGFDLASFTLYTSLRGLCGCLLLPLAVKLLKKGNLRVLLTGAVLCFTLSNFLMGTFTELWQWYLTAAVQGAASSFLVFVTTPLLLGNWFAAHLGLAVGLSSAFSGVFGILANPLGSLVLEAMGWRAAYFVLSACSLALTAPFTALILRDSPEKMGLCRLGEEAIWRGAGSPRAEAGGPPSGSPAACLAAVLFLQLAAMATMGFTQLLPSYGAAQGLSPTTAATLVSCSMAGNTVGKFVLGMGSDRFGAYRVSLLSFLLPLGGFGLLLFGGGGYAAAFLTGISMPAAMVVMPLLIRKVYGSFRYERVYTLASVLGNVAWAASTPLFSLLYQRTGQYRSGILLNILLLGGSVGAVMLLARKTS